MDKQNILPKRKKNRLEDFDYSSCGAYFITICTSKRQNCFWKNTSAKIDCPQDVELSRYGELANEAVKNISQTYPAISVETYVIMPNHLHLLLLIKTDDLGRPMVAPTISRVIKQLKGFVSKRAGVSFWQKSFYDRVIRNREEYQECAKYIYENPLRWYYDELYFEE